MMTATKKSLETSLSYQPKQSFIEVKGMTFCVEERGDPLGPPIMLIMGLACQMTHWPESLLDGLAEQGYRVIRFDNRDIGLSDKLSSSFRVNTRLAYLAHKLGRHPHANYTLHDMANDTANLMSALDIEHAHIVGVSMGGMISQLLAANYSDQVRTLTTIMSSTNAPGLPMPELSLMLKLGQTGKATKDMTGVTKRWQNFWEIVQSPGYPTSSADIRALMEANYLRSYSPGGTIRQIQAILATGSLEKMIQHIIAPTLVIHGGSDPLLRPTCGRAISKQIKGAKFRLIPKMGHDLPEQLVPQFVRLISEHAK